MRQPLVARRSVRAVALLTAAGLVAAACSGDDDDDDGGATADTVAETAEPGTEAPGTEPPVATITAGSTPGTDAPGTVAPGAEARPLVIARDMDLNSLDISRSYCDTCQIFNTAVYETLLTVAPGDPNTLIPRLATAWEANDDNTVFTFTLDPTATFADGSPVEAADVKFSWERLAGLQGSASYLVAGIESIEAPDASTVVVTLPAPNSAFLPVVGAPYLGIINSELAESNGATTDGTTDAAEEWFFANSAGSGPYQLESYVEGESLVLAGNDGYWRGAPAFPEVTLLQVQDSTSQLQQLQQGDVDIAMQISFDALPQLDGNADVTTSVVDSFNFVYIALSPGAVGGENLQDPEVRKAIRSAIDIDGAIDALVAGNGKPQAAPIPNGFIGTADLAMPAYDPDAAIAALEAAGLGDGFSLDATYPEANVYGVDFSLMMQKVQQDLAKINVNLELTPVQFPEWIERISSEGIPVTAVYFAPDHTDPSQYIQYFGLIPDSSWSGWAGGGAAGEPLINPAESELLTTALASTGTAREEAYTALGEAMIDDAVVIPIVNPQLVLASASDITGMHYSACCNLDLGLLGISG